MRARSKTNIGANIEALTKAEIMGLHSFNDIIAALEQINELERHTRVIKRDQLLHFAELRNALIQKATLQLDESNSKINISTKSTHNRFYTAGSIALTFVNGLMSGIGSYIGFFNIFQLMANNFHYLTNIVGVLVGIVDCIASVLFSAWDFHKDYGLSVIFSDKNVIKEKEKQLKLIRLLQKECIKKLCKKTYQTPEILKVQKIIRINTDNLKHYHASCEVAKPRSYLQSSLKWAYLTLSGILKFGGGMLLGKGVLIAIGLTSLSTPIGIIVSAAVGLFMAASYITLKAKSTNNVLCALLNRRNDSLNRKITDFIYTRKEPKLFDKQVAILLSNGKHPQLSKLKGKKNLIHPNPGRQNDKPTPATGISDKTFIRLKSDVERAKISPLNSNSIFCHRRNTKNKNKKLFRNSDYKMAI